MGDFPVIKVDTGATLGALGAASELAAPTGPLGNPASGEGAVRVVGSNSYGKTYHFFSGSVINRAEYQEQGYQNTFDFMTHRYEYAEIITTYEEIETYTKVGDVSITTQSTREMGTEGTRTASSTTTDLASEYDWVRSERNPTVESSYGDYNLLTPEGSMGIISESTSGYEDVDTRSHETPYTDNNISLGSYNISEGEGYLHVKTDTSERDFIQSLFGYDSNQSFTDIIDDFFNTIATDVFRTTFADRNSFQAIQPHKLITTDLYGLPSNEVVETAARDTPVEGLTDFTGEFTTTSTAESEAMATMYSGPSWSSYE